MQLRVISSVEEYRLTSLTEKEAAAALDRGDELGKLVLRAFSFDIPAFREIMGDILPDERGAGN